METKRDAVTENGVSGAEAPGESSKEAQGSAQNRSIGSAYAQEPHNEWGGAEVGATTARRHTPIEADCTQALPHQPPSIPGLQMDDVLTQLDSARKEEESEMVM